MAQSAPRPEIEITSTVHSVVFSNGETGYSIFFAYPSGSSNPARDRFTAVGSVGTLRDKERVILRGEWGDHPKFGRQFRIAQFELPDFKAGGVLPFLESGYIKGVGPALAKAIFAKFGDKTAEIFDTDPEQLLTVQGIGKVKLESMVESWREHSGKREVLSEFSQYGIGGQTIQKILKCWENPRDAIKVLNTNPYLLAWKISGVGFRKADEIAQKKGFGLKHPLRVQAAIAYSLEEAAQKNGHCFLHREVLFEDVNMLLNPELPDRTVFQPEDVRLINAELATLIDKQKVVEKEGGRMYLSSVYFAESRLEQNLLTLLSAPAPALQPAKELSEYEQENGITLHDQQRAAVLGPLQCGVYVITGGPGTGKTTIIKALLAILGKDAGEISLTAPTGRAAKRMAESTGKSAQTIHRLLGVQGGHGFTYTKDNRLPADLVIVDEASMLDVFLAKSLTDALKPGARLVLLGDVDQLPSVSAGAVLKDLLACPRIARTRLTKIYRQSPNSFISVNAQAVIGGKIGEMNLTNNTDDFFWMGIDHCCAPNSSPFERTAAIQDKIRRAVLRLLQVGYSSNDIQVLSPTYAGEAGVNKLNSILQDILNPGVIREKIGAQTLSVGDRVMQLRNNYDKDVFNGDQGRVALINHQEKNIDVEFDGRVISYPFNDADELTLAYAITIHKAQGSESPAIIMPVTTAQYMMLQRNLIYTGITRAKRMCVLVGEKKALSIAVRAQNTKPRNTHLLATAI